MRTIKFEKMLTDLKKTIDRKEIDLLPPYVFTGEVKVIEEERQVGEAADFLSKHTCLGFDTETRPAFRKGEIYKVSLLQLAVPERVFLFRLNKCGFQPALVRLLASPRIIKIGVGIRDDNRNLRKLADFTPASFVDLQEYAGYFPLLLRIAQEMRKKRPFLPFSKKSGSIRPMAYVQDTVFTIRHPGCINGNNWRVSM